MQLGAGKIEFYRENYGVELNEGKNGNIKVSGNSENFNSVSYMVKEDIHLSENKHKIPEYREVKGSMSSKLISYDNNNISDFSNNMKDTFKNKIFSM